MNSEVYLFRKQQDHRTGCAKVGVFQHGHVGDFPGDEVHLAFFASVHEVSPYFERGWFFGDETDLLDAAVGEVPDDWKDVEGLALGGVGEYK